jgi:uncharacterized protein YecT (DUF1311 family)
MKTHSVLDCWPMKSHPFLTINLTCSRFHSLIRNLTLYQLGLASIIWLAFIAPSRAASFDCAKARSAFEVSICSDAGVSKIDTTMGKVYQKAMDHLSKGGQKLLRENQLTFLEDVRSICLSTNQLLVDHRTPSNREYDVPAYRKKRPVFRCLTFHLQNRIDSGLATAVQQFGKRRLLNLSSNRLRRPTAMAPAGYDDHIIEESLSLIQIDAPKTQAEHKFNSWTRGLLTSAVCNVRSASDDSPCTLERNEDRFATVDTDIWAGVSAVMISDDLAAIELDVGNYWLGAAHPTTKETRALWSFSLGRTLRPTDIFDPRKSWDSSLARYAQRHVRSSIEGMKKADLQPVTSIASPANWSFERGGLRLIYGQYELGGYLDSAEVFLPWRIVVPYLRPKGIFDWRAVARGPSGNGQRLKEFKG